MTLHAPDNQPWSAPANTLKEAGVRLDDTYPRPRVELSAGRKRALDALSAFKALQAA